MSSAGEYALAARSWILTQEAASVMTGISVTTYQKIENGHRMPRLENVVKLVDRLSIDSRALFLELGDFLPD
ncbi:helix-turn-helix domain-containing protein [Williamsia sterculiae]|uniref:helix-turn-helix domain-containing protein n=1 Tax=Williamsia sterculiae TaxID=1344003 RepID=UPI001F352974|nr:helix-turn-helix transcriptional regulator [Williamsia sterculiae]